MFSQESALPIRCLDPSPWLDVKMMLVPGSGPPCFGVGIPRPSTREVISYVDTMMAFVV